MKRWTARIIVFLFLGAIINVAVAWGCSWWGLPRFLKAEATNVVAFWGEGRVPPTLTNSELPSVVTQGFGLIEHCVFPAVMPGVKSEWSSPKQYSTLLAINVQGAASYGGHCSEREMFQQLFDADGNPNNNIECLALRTDAGWPVQSLRGWGPGTSRAYEQAMRRGIAWQLEANAIVKLRRSNAGCRVKLPRVIPLRPIWPGFAINTIFYAAILCGLFAVPLVLRRRWRRGRGLCPKCAYDLRGHTPESGVNVCPECGSAPLSAKTISP